MDFLGYVGAQFENHQYSLKSFPPSYPPGFFLVAIVSVDVISHENPTFTWFSHLGRYLQARKLMPDLLKEKARWNSWLRFASGQKKKARGTTLNTPGRRVFIPQLPVWLPVLFLPLQGTCVFFKRKEEKRLLVFFQAWSSASYPQKMIAGLSNWLLRRVRYCLIWCNHFNQKFIFSLCMDLKETFYFLF